MVHILDTDHVSLLENGCFKCAQRLMSIGCENVAITVVTVEERLQGWLGAVQRASTSNQSDRLVWAYSGLRKTVQYVNGFIVLDWTELSNQKFLELRQERVRIGTRDLRIAAIALAANGVIVTRNQKDFSRVPGLQLEDWSG